MKTNQSHCPAIVFATKSGGATIDQDAYGGNPFATALIRVANMPNISLKDFPVQLRTVTTEVSNGHQVPQWCNWPVHKNWSFQHPVGSRQTSRCALLLMVSDYSASHHPRLSGAAHDERRLAAMFAANGFTVVQGICPRRSSLLEALVRFRRLTVQHEEAAIYCTGHGIELNSKVYLLPGDFPVANGYSKGALMTRAIAVDRIANACRARQLNFVFFAGCRTMPAKMPKETF